MDARQVIDRLGSGQFMEIVFRQDEERGHDSRPAPQCERASAGPST